VRVDGEAFAVALGDVVDDRLRVTVDGRPCEVHVRGAEGGAMSFLVDGVSHLVDVEERAEGLAVVVDGERFQVVVDDPARPRSTPGPAPRAGEQRLVAPMPGKVVAVHVRVGEPVQSGTPLLVLEAMKMENEFRAAGAGTVTEVRVCPGQPVNAGDLLVVVAGDAT
jgi:3-methylcrotonyl-CoA carboxylase alpha subunit